jgi:hypothetical protein
LRGRKKAIRGMLYLLGYLVSCMVFDKFSQDYFMGEMVTYE